MASNVDFIGEIDDYEEARESTYRRSRGANLFRKSNGLNPMVLSTWE